MLQKLLPIWLLPLCLFAQAPTESLILPAPIAFEVPPAEYLEGGVRNASLRSSARDNDAKATVYRVRALWSALGGVGGMLIGTAGIDRLRRKDRLTEAELGALRPEDVPGIDRWGLRQDPARSKGAEASSDLFFNGAMVLPFTLFLDRKYRKDWLDISLIYLEAHALNANFYAWAPVGPAVINRLRPVAYYESIDVGIRGAGNSRNSFFSGHVSTTAVGTFFTAKVLSDYNPHWTGRQRALIFGAAALPPIYVAVQRVRSLKHFPTDTVAGLAVGAFFGVFTPHLHKIWQRKHRSRLTLSGTWSEGLAAGGLRLTF